MNIVQIVDVHCQQRLSVCHVIVLRVIGQLMLQMTKTKSYESYEQTYYKEDSS